MLRYHDKLSNVKSRCIAQFRVHSTASEWRGLLVDVPCHVHKAKSTAESETPDPDSNGLAPTLAVLHPERRLGRRRQPRLNPAQFGCGFTKTDALSQLAQSRAHAVKPRSHATKPRLRLATHCGPPSYRANPRVPRTHQAIPARRLTPCFATGNSGAASDLDLLVESFANPERNIIQNGHTFQVK